MKKAFTLIELLIVVAIIAILAAIAVPNFLEAQMRAKVSRVLSDQRTYATALETYYIDNNSYPLYAPFTAGTGYTVPTGMNNTTNWNSQMFTQQGLTGTNYANSIASFALSSTAAHVIGLTSPVSYLSTYVPDTFTIGAKNATFAYCQGPAGFLIWSPGPDGVDSLDYNNNATNTNNAEWIVRGGQALPSPFLIAGAAPIPPSAVAPTIGFTYDATNGTASGGDVYRTK